MLRQIRKSLSAYVSWLRLLPALKIRVPSRLLPAVVDCPLCKSHRLSIFGDASTGGQWHYCGGCHAHGDMLQLAAAVWQVSLPAAVQRLSTMGFEFGDAPPTLEAVQAHETTYILRPQALAKFWAESRKQFIQGTAEVGHLLQTLGLRSPLVGAQLLNGPGLMLGAAKKVAVEAAFLPNSFGPTNGCQSDHRVLYGPGWRDCLAIPYYDQPGRLRAFLFIGRKGEPADFAFKSLYLDRSAAFGKTVEAGLSFHPQVLLGESDWDNTLIALEDPVLMIRLQQKHFALFSRPLPFVSWRDDGKYATQQAWNMFHGRKIVFWSPKATAGVLQQVMRVDGWLVLGNSEKYWGERNAHDCVKRVLNAAKPWREAIADWLEKAKDPEIEDLFHSLRLQGVPTNRLVERCRPAIQTRVATLLKQDLVQNSLTLGGTTILEQSDGWFATGRGGESSLIADACLRIERVLHRAGRDETYYQGHVLYKNEQVPYCDHRAAVEKGGFNWMRTLLIRKEKGLLHFDSKWNARMVSIAVQLHPPEFLSGADAVGWDEKRSGFTLPSYTLLPNLVEPNPEGFFGDDAPARHLRLPEVLSPAEAQILTEDEPAERTGWAVAGCLLANILAPTFGQQPTGVALVGRGAELIGRALAAPLGCRRLTLDNSRKTEERSLAAEQEHRWPSYVDIPLTAMPVTVARWLEGGGPIRSAMAPLDWLHAVPAQFLGTWRLLRDDASTGLPGAYTLAMHKVVPAYLAYLLNNRLDIGLGEGWLPGVFESLAGWVESLGGRPETVRSGLEAVLDVTPHGTADSFGDLLCRLYTDGKLAFVQHGYQEERGRPTLVGGDDGSLSVPKTALGLLPSKGRIDIDPLKITAALAGAGLLLGETDEAWGVPLTWWSRRLHSWRAVRARLLRVKT